MSYLRDRAIVLRNEPFKEHDRKVVLFGREHGLLEAVARGASRKEAKQAGHIVPMSEVEVLIAKGVVYDKLAVARIVEQHRAVRERLGALTFVGAFFDLFEQLQRPGIVDPGLYELLLDVLSVAESLPQEPTALRVRLLWSAAALKLLDRIGLAPDWSQTRSFEPTVMPLLHFLRREPLGRVLLLTGSAGVFTAASQAIEAALEQAPLESAPRGSQTIAALLSSIVILNPPQADEGSLSIRATI